MFIKFSITHKCKLISYYKNTFFWQNRIIYTVFVAFLLFAIYFEYIIEGRYQSYDGSDVNTITICSIV